MALDSIVAMSGAASVTQVIVVTDADAEQIRRFEAEGAEVFPDPSTGLNNAVAFGLQTVPHDLARGVLLGDLACLHASDLDSALRVAQEHSLAFVPDSEGTGTTLITAQAGVPLVSRFGADSARHHTDAGFHRLSLPLDSSLRLDVDTADDYDRAVARGVGRYLSALLYDAPFADTVD